MSDQIDKLFGWRVRVRACGLCWKNGKLLLVNHRGLTKGDFWAPPGGGVEFGKSIHETLKGEFLEETGLVVEPGEFRFVCEFIRETLHAVELFFDVTSLSGKLKVGTDPELPDESQILRDIRLMRYEEVVQLPANERHGLFTLFPTEKALRLASGCWKI